MYSSKKKRIYYCYTECNSVAWHSTKFIPQFELLLISLSIHVVVVIVFVIHISSFGVLVTYLQEKQLYHFLQ